MQKKVNFKDSLLLTKVQDFKITVGYEKKCPLIK